MCIFIITGSYITLWHPKFHFYHIQFKLQIHFIQLKYIYAI